jgi:phage major head subunit gpT-like protein
MITKTDVLMHMERGMRAGFLKGMQGYTPRRTQFCRTVPSTGSFEQYGDLGALPWPARISGQGGPGGTDARTGSAVVSGNLTGGSITVLGTNERKLIVFNDGWNIPVGITHDAINDGALADLESWARSAGNRFEQHKDFLAFDALNSGEATTNYGACYDTLSFFNDSHVDPGAEYVTVQDNKLATGLSYANFKAARIAAGKFKDNRGQPAGYIHDLLIVALDLEEEAAQLTLNPERYDVADRSINPYRGSIKPLVAPGGWLDSTAWYLAVSGLDAKPVNLQERLAPQLYFWDDHTQGGGVRYYKWYARYTPFYGDWRLCIQGQT